MARLLLVMTDAVQSHQPSLDPADAESILQAIQAVLRAPGLISAETSQAAAERNAGRISDRRAVLAVQKALHMRPTAMFDAATVQSVACRQRTLGVRPIDGVIDDVVLHDLIGSLVRSRAFDEALHLAVTYHSSPNLHGQRLDSTLAPTLYEADYDVRSLGAGPAAVAFSPTVLAQSPARLAQCIARAREDVHLRRLDTPAPVRDFLLEHFIALSTSDGFVRFMDHVAAVLDRYADLAPRQRRAQRSKLDDLWREVFKRWPEGTDSERQIFRNLKEELRRLCSGGAPRTH